MHTNCLRVWNKRFAKSISSVCVCVKYLRWKIENTSLKRKEFIIESTAGDFMIDDIEFYCLVTFFK